MLRFSIFARFHRLIGLENALAGLPSGVGVELKSSIDKLLQSPPEGTAPQIRKERSVVLW